MEPRGKNKLDELIKGIEKGNLWAGLSGLA